jgi:alcohol dehydrogenase (cytochrome c)
MTDTAMASALRAVRCRPRLCLSWVVSIAVAGPLAIPGRADAQGHETNPATTMSGDQWPTYNNGYKGQRFSPLTQITARNIGSLKEVCRLKLQEGGSLQTGPVVVDRVMYLTTALDTFAIDPSQCTLLWKSSYQSEQTLVFPVNRGVAVMNGRIFRGTPDGRLLALDARTGELLWRDIVGDPTLNEFVPGAPLAWNGLVITGTAAGDLGVKGRVLAYDALTGREVWRFTTIPTGKEIGADSWDVRQAAETGGGGTWSSFALDVVTGEVFIPVGNPAPSFAPEYRPGANLFTDSLVVLDARTGALKWWYQLDRNDGHDLDLAAAPMLYTNGDGRDVVAVAGKDGYVQVLDRLTHRLLFKTMVTTIKNEGVRPSELETLFCPGGVGGTEWNGPALDPQSRTLFVGAVDWCMHVKSTHETRFVKSQGKELYGARVALATDPAPSGWLSALDSDSGRIKWKYHADAPIIAGVTSMAGGIVLTGDTAGNILALDSATGGVLYKKDTGGAIAGGIITYAVGGRQYIAFTSGNVSRSIFGAVGVPTIVVMAVDANALNVIAVDGTHRNDPGDQEDTNGVANGRELYGEYCSSCHGASGGGAIGPSLSNLGERRSAAAIIRWLENPKPPMPKLYPAPLGERELRNIASFILGF